MEKTAIFVDGAYLESLLREEFGKPKVDFQKMAVALGVGAQLLRTYYYNCPPFQSNPITDEERKRGSAADGFYNALRRLPRFEVRLGKLAYRGKDVAGKPIFVQKRVDIMLGVDLVELAATRQIGRAVLLAGDSDFVPAVEAAKRHGVLVVLAHGQLRGPNRTVDQELWDCCDERIAIDQHFIDKISR